MSSVYPQAIKLDQVIQLKNVKITKEILWEKKKNKTLIVLLLQGFLSSVVIHFVQI